VPAVPPKLAFPALRGAARLWLTIISLPFIAGNAVQTNGPVKGVPLAAQEGTSAGFHRRRVSIDARLSLSVSTGLLSSINASILLGSPVGLYYLQNEMPVKGG
jgi:hypothetical protein